MAGLDRLVVVSSGWSGCVRVRLASSEHNEDCHEVQFLEVKTSKGSFTMSSHNEHNGYYGGFSIEVRPED